MSTGSWTIRIPVHERSENRSEHREMQRIFIVERHFRNRKDLITFIQQVCTINVLSSAESTHPKQFLEETERWIIWIHLLHDNVNLEIREISRF